MGLARDLCLCRENGLKTPVVVYSISIHEVGLKASTIQVCHMSPTLLWLHGSDGA